MPGVLVFPALKSLLLLGLVFSSVFALSWARFLPGLRAIFSLRLISLVGRILAGV